MNDACDCFSNNNKMTLGSYVYLYLNGDTNQQKKTAERFA